MKLKELKFPDLKGNKKYNFLFPVGSTEQHGPFLPFGTDTYLTDYLVEQVEKAFPDLIILPTLEYSRAQEHKEFFGTAWLSEETMEKVLFDVCFSLLDKASYIFFTSFHANSKIFQGFVEKHKKSFPNITIVQIEIFNEDDDEKIKKLLHGPIDEHAGNTEIATMLTIHKDLVMLPPSDFPKTHIDDPFATDNLLDKSPTGVADNHPEWVVNQQIGDQVLSIYAQRMIENLHLYLH